MQHVWLLLSACCLMVKLKYKFFLLNYGWSHLTCSCLCAVITAACVDVIKYSTLEVFVAAAADKMPIPVLVCGGTQSICHLSKIHMLCRCCSFAETTENLLTLQNQPACKYLSNLMHLGHCH